MAVSTNSPTSFQNVAFTNRPNLHTQDDSRSQRLSLFIFKVVFRRLVHPVGPARNPKVDWDQLAR